MSTGCKSSHNGFLDVSCSNGGLRISGWIGQLSFLTNFSTSLSVAGFLHTSKPWERCRTEGTRDEVHGKVQQHIVLLYLEMKTNIPKVKLMVKSLSVSHVNLKASFLD